MVMTQFQSQSGDLGLVAGVGAFRVDKLGSWLTHAIRVSYMRRSLLMMCILVKVYLWVRLPVTLAAHARRGLIPALRKFFTHSGFFAIF